MRHRIIGASLFGFGALLVTASVGLLLFPAEGIVSGSPAQDIPPFTDHACLDCHTNEARLRDLAVKPEPPEESLSSGPG
ncbi:MAG: hypothetical protein K8I60_03835 [Anaerolineae bacterium]|nr:hypothetical protein [Anaerolineae bacterium]